MNNSKLNQWLGKQQIAQAVISADTANLMQAALNRGPNFSNGDELPPAWHWLYFHEPTLAENLGVEGHEKLGGFMPPVSFGDGDGKIDEPPRRMWAGGTLTFKTPIRLGELATKRSTINSITSKEGRSGQLVFVVVGHEILVDEEPQLLEEQTIVYREPVARESVQADSGPVAAQAAPTDSDFSAQYQPDPMLLFRYSALTFNAHRIHYDVDFCRSHEGYPDLVVHGPLTATLLLDLFYHQRPAERITRFEYRGRSPLFNPRPFMVHGRADGEAWASNDEGGLAMSAQVSFK